MPPADPTRVDLHVHSRYSRESDLWILRQTGVAESNTDPETVYKACKKRGMNYVTLTDHNTIEGALRLADRDDFFISEEVTTYFPDEQIKLHLLALGIDENQHRQIQCLRPNLYELVAYLNQENIVYVLAHPLTRLGGELKLEHVERLMLLFPLWEVHNGSTLERENSLSRRLAQQCSHERLLKLAEKHNLEPVTRDRIGFTAGSDDHSGFDIASAWTTTATSGSVRELLHEVRAGRTETGGAHGSTLKLAHTMLGLLDSGAGNFENEAGKSRPNENGESRRSAWAGMGLAATASAQKWLSLASLALGSNNPTGLIKMVMSDPELRQALFPLLTASAKTRKRRGEKFHEQLFALVTAAWGAGMRSTLTGLSDISLFNVVDNLDKIGRMVALQMLLLPHGLAANYHSRQRHFLCRLEKEAFANAPAADKARLPRMEPQAGSRVALFTDTYDEVNGVAGILRRLAEFSEGEKLPLDIICSGGDAKGKNGRVIRFPAVASLALPEYGQLSLTIPPVLDIIKYCEEQEFEVIHAATPGPMGLAAFLVSRILQVPLVASYHTDVPRCIGRITDDKLNEEIAWTYLRWFYRHSDLTLVPSIYTSRDLGGHGFDHHKMAFLYQAVDTDRFSPAFRSLNWRKRKGAGNKKILLFAGRLSEEKDLRFLAECYLELTARRDDVHLVIVGDGPLRGELENMLAGQATFTGWLEGENLATAYASADLFIFPSSVDTSGQVVLEAQASGLPVICCSHGGACENMKPGVSGLTAQSRNLEEFIRHIETILDDEDMRSAMAQAARQFVKPRSWEKVFGELFDIYGDLLNSWQPLSVTRSESAGDEDCGSLDSGLASEGAGLS